MKTSDATTGPAAGKIPFLELNPGWMIPEECFDAYFDATAELSDLFIPNPRDRMAGVEARSWLLDNLIFIDARVCAHTMYRRSRHLRQSESTLISLIIGSGRSSHMLLEGRSLELDSRSFHFIDFSREQVEDCHEEAFSCVYLPHRALGYDPSRHPPYMRLGLNTISGYILYTAFRHLHQRLSDVTETEAAHLAAGFTGLVGGLFLNGSRSSPAEEFMAPARKLSMHRYVEEHLGDPGLSIERLAGVFNASRATVYRHFAEAGGVSNYIYSRRLERAYAELAGSPRTRGQISRVASTNGFVSLSHFSKRFRDRFGILPSEILGSSRDSGSRHRLNDPGSCVDFREVGSWVRSLKS